MQNLIDMPRKRFIILIIAFALPYVLTAQSKTYTIAYNVTVKDTSGKTNYEVFTIEWDGSQNQNISRSKALEWTYMAHEDQLYMISDRDTCTRCYFLYRTDADGNIVKKVSDLQLEDSWMDTRNGGKEIIVSGRIGKSIRHQLFMIDAETGAFTQFTNDTSAYHRDPVFSPDGSQIAYVYRKNKRDRSIFDEVYVVNTDHTDGHQLTTYPRDNVSATSNGYKAGATRWHPTENMITYISMQDGRHNIFYTSPDGTKQGRLTANDFPEGWHDWSPDGKWLVFDTSNEDESQYHIMLMNWETKVVTQLTDTTYQYQQCPVFIKK